MVLLCVTTNNSTVFHVLTVLTVKVTIFYDMAACCLILIVDGLLSFRNNLLSPISTLNIEAADFFQNGYA